MLRGIVRWGWATALSMAARAGSTVTDWLLLLGKKRWFPFSVGGGYREELALLYFGREKQGGVLAWRIGPLAVLCFGREKQGGVLAWRIGPLAVLCFGVETREKQGLHGMQMNERSTKQLFRRRFFRGLEDRRPDQRSVW
ncbi:hypothetical protein I3843_14G133500 [Carya illinoinensis]|nr:hypothetical protein I3843_14G133500 [Carya illinoinensis]